MNNELSVHEVNKMGSLEWSKFQINREYLIEIVSKKVTVNNYQYFVKIVFKKDG